MAFAASKNQGVKIPSAPHLGFAAGGGPTVEVLVRADSGGHVAGSAAKVPEGAVLLTVAASKWPNYQLAGKGGQGAAAEWQQSLADGKWRRLAGVNQGPGGEVQLAVDGVVQAAKPYVATGEIPTHDWGIGSRLSDSPLTGAISTAG